MLHWIKGLRACSHVGERNYPEHFIACNAIKMYDTKICYVRTEYKIIQSTSKLYEIQIWNAQILQKLAVALYHNLCLRLATSWIAAKSRATFTRAFRYVGKSKQPSSIAGYITFHGANWSALINRTGVMASCLHPIPIAIWTRALINARHRCRVSVLYDCSPPSFSRRVSPSPPHYWREF